jgi:hypothetical protein
MHSRFQIHMFSELSPSVSRLAERKLVFAACDDTIHVPSWDLKTDISLMWVTMSNGLSLHIIYPTHCLARPRKDGYYREAGSLRQLQNDEV